jgi:hypothetical protein
MANNLEALMNELDDKNQALAAKYRASHWTRKYRNDVLRAACLKCQIDLPSTTTTKDLVAEAIVDWVRNLFDGVDVPYMIHLIQLHVRSNRTIQPSITIDDPAMSVCAPNAGGIEVQDDLERELFQQGLIEYDSLSPE